MTITEGKQLATGTIGKRLTVLGVAILIVLFIYRFWLSGNLYAGDIGISPWNDQFEYQLIPSSWDSYSSTGLGEPSYSVAWLHIINTFPRLAGSILGNFPESNVFPYFVLYLILLCLGIYRISTVFRFSLHQTYVSALVIASNSYILMVTAGGQRTIMIAYALAFIIATELIRNTISDLSVTSFRTDVKNSIWCGLLLLVLSNIDLRIAYIMFLVYGWLLIIRLAAAGLSFRNIWHTVRTAIFSGGVFIAGNLYWLYPTLVYPSTGSGAFSSAHTSSAAVRFFSFADFSNAISLLHPNWPENIFGKTYFLRPEFLLIPIIAYSALLFNISFRNRVGRDKMVTWLIPVLIIISVTGTFLAKGTKEPFGFIYIWLFSVIPGFVMFRDPTKWYVLIVLSYSVLIPFAVRGIYRSAAIRRIIRAFLPNIPDSLIAIATVLTFTVIWLFTVRQAITGTLTGTFAQREISPEYGILATKLTNVNEYFRTLWVPMVQRYAFRSVTHPAVDLSEALDVSSSSAVISWLTSSAAKETVQHWSVRYVIVPLDSEGDIFVKDRVFDPEKFNETVAALDSIPWLRRIDNIGRLPVWETYSWDNHIYLGYQSDLVYQRINSTHFRVNIPPADTVRELTLSERYDPYWSAVTEDGIIKPRRSVDNLNVFDVPSGVNSLDLKYLPQSALEKGLMASLILVSAYVVLYILLKIF
ncbi:hypothetical protein A2Z33_05545 [Candidatus Gottesmanbacteria bacterium RBG_16_52_11]|uniref:Glycosyltransferase RgtA/B/C/D-like domain-containing protein n=1 Tax=Candidatus Gottesmanbacteria bacterium RBG_16_52_11 TaxID=1798374 RepID=A0A1F5YNY7_9BACT|nr:MAG: hypothetical protein A2Z33_05545 [Candidatus Gottesmanbacteria bacterium RBG_16_52_11]